MRFNLQDSNAKEKKLMNGKGKDGYNTPFVVASGILFQLVFTFFVMIGFGQTAHAAAPIITSPNDSIYEIMTGHLLRIPFSVVEPDNEIVDYSVTNFNGSGLPDKASLQQIPTTGEWEFTWWPDSDNIGSHTFQFHAADEKGSKTVKEITVEVKPATDAPALFVSREIDASGIFNHYNDSIYIQREENTSLDFRVDLAGISGHKLSLDIGVADDRGKTLDFRFQKPPRRWKGTENTYFLRRYLEPSNINKRGDRGIYKGFVTVRDEVTNQVTRVPITFDIGLKSHASKNSRQIPYAVINIHDTNQHTSNWTVVNGTVPLDLKFIMQYGRGDEAGSEISDLTKETSLQYVLYTPPDGKKPSDTNNTIEISPVLKENYAFNWNTTKVPDGTYVMGVKWVDGPHLNTLMVRTPQVIIENAGDGFTKGAQMVPVSGFYYDDNSPRSYMPDWVSFSGKRRPSRVHPYPYRFIPPASELNNPMELVGDNTKWFVESLIHNTGGTYEDIPGFVRTTEGHIVSEGFYAQASNTVEKSLDKHSRHYYWCLGRGRSTVSPYSTFTPVPGNEPGWYGVDISGRVFWLQETGHVTTIAGYVTRDQDQIVPHDPLDSKLDQSNRLNAQARIVGDFVEEGTLNFFNKTTDLVLDPFNPKVIYITDAGNHRIAKLEFDRINVAGNRITTYAGLPGVKGHRDGAGNVALFNDPYSLDIDPRTGIMYVADRMNNAIRKIIPPRSAGGVPTVSTIVGGPNGPKVPHTEEIRGKESEKMILREQLTNTVGFSNASINYPQALRLDSKGNIIFLEDWTRSVRRVNFKTGKVERIDWLPDSHWGTWIWLDVDTEGVIGPKDDILVAISESLGTDYRTGERFHNTLILRYASDGSRPRGEVVPPGIKTLSMKGWAANVQESMTHYPWAVAIDDREARFIATGFGSEGIYSLRMKMPGDPVGYNRARFDEALIVHETGTASAFPAPVRPPFSEMVGYRGFNQFGDSVLNFDDMALLDENVNPKDPDGTADSRAFRNNVDIANFIRGGMDGMVRRPEITGRDLASYIYFIRFYSLEGEIREIDIAEIEQELQMAGLHNVNDSRNPEIRNVVVTPIDSDSVRVSWQTDEPTIGLVEYGPSRWYGLYSNFESDFEKSHSIEIHNLLNNGISKGEYHFSIRAKDIAGNVSVTRDAVFTTPVFEATPEVSELKGLEITDFTSETILKKRPYELFDLEVDERMYNDRLYKFTSIPSFFVGHRAIRTAHKDRFSRTSNPDFIRFKVNQSVDVYIIYSKEGSQIESNWLNESKGWNLENYTVLSNLRGQHTVRLVRKKTFDAGIIKLPGNGGRRNPNTMYNVVIKPAEPGLINDKNAPSSQFTVANLKSETINLNNSYELFDLKPKAKMYMDRNYKFISVPRGLRGHKAIRTGNIDRFSKTSNLDFIRFDVNESVDVYIIFTNKRSRIERDWLNESNGWLLEKDRVRTNVYGKNDLRFIRKKTFNAGTIILPGNGGRSSRNSMYNVVIKPTKADDNSNFAVTKITAESIQLPRISWRSKHSLKSKIDSLSVESYKKTKMKSNPLQMKKLSKRSVKSEIDFPPTVKMPGHKWIYEEKPDYSGDLRSLTVYESAEDATTLGWYQYGKGSVSNIRGGANGSERAVEVTGNIETDVFRLAKEDGSDWKNDEEFFTEFYIALDKPGSGAVYFQVNTNAGIKYLVYADDAVVQGDDPDLIYISLGDMADGHWHKVFRSFEDDLKTSIPDAKLEWVKALFVYGSVKLDNVRLLNFASEQKEPKVAISRN